MLPKSRRVTARALLICRAGCDLQDIVHALGLEVVDLFAHNERPPQGATKKAARTTTAAEEDLTTDELPDGTYWEFTSPAGEVQIGRAHV